MSSKETHRANVLPESGRFTLNCAVEQTDQFQADFLEAYGDMLYEREKVKRQTVGWLIFFALASIVILAVPAVVNQYLWFTGAFAAMALLYGIYFCTSAYRKDYILLQRHLENAVDRGITVYEPQLLSYEFTDDRVFITDSEGKKRFFLYSDVHYFEQTDRFYIFGMKYLPREHRLDGLERVLITKRFLSGANRRDLEELIANVAEEYGVKPVLEDHPFK